MDMRWASALAIAAWLLVTLVGLSRRRLPRATLWRYAVLWAAIFALLFVGAVLVGGRT